LLLISGCVTGREGVLTGTVRELPWLVPMVSRVPAGELARIRHSKRLLLLVLL